MRFTRAVRPTLFLASLWGCGDGGTAPTASSGLSGNNAGFFHSHHEILAIHLQAANGQLSGTGWSTITDTALNGGSITGTYAGQDVHFDMHPLSGTGDWHFNGVFASDTLKGDFAIVAGFGFAVELSRVDTVPTGRASTEIAGALSLTATGRALFDYEQPGFRVALVLVAAGSPTYVTRVVWERSSPPVPGSYTLSPEGGTAPTATFVRFPAGLDPRSLTFMSGTLVVDVSNRYAILGHTDLLVTDPLTGMQSTVHVSFSAGCLSSYC